MTDTKSQRVRDAAAFFFPNRMTTSFLQQCLPDVSRSTIQRVIKTLPEQPLYAQGTENFHIATQCKAQPCAVHNPSDHYMRSYPLNIRWDRGGFQERICPHGTGHPDPDYMRYLKRHLSPSAYLAEGVHGCDGCCEP